MIHTIEMSATMWEQVDKPRIKKGMKRIPSALLADMCEEIGEGHPEKDIVDYSILKRHKGGCDLLFVGEAPGVDEVREGEAFVGVSGQLLRAGLEDDIFCDKNIILDNSVPFGIPDEKGRVGRGKPTKELIEACSDKLDYMIFAHRPKVIVLLGQYALQTFGILGKITSRNGEVMKLDYYDGTYSWVVCCYHPAAILYSPSLGEEFESSMEKAGNLVDAEERAKKLFLISSGDRYLFEDKFYKSIEKKLVCVDLETTSLDPDKGRVLCAAFAWRETSRSKIQCRYILNPDMKKLSRWWIKVPRIAHHAKFEQSWIRPSRLTLYHCT